MKESELKNILHQDFDFEKNWRHLFSLLFNKVQYFSNPSNPFSENAKVKSGKQTGVVKLDDGKVLAIFEVEVDDSIRIDRNRKGLREIAIKHIDQNITHGAFVFFYSKNQTDYRFSFIAKWSELDLNTGEFIKGETKPKRYTYLLGDNEACTTAAKRLLLLQTKRENLTIIDILEVFSVEALTKEFYNELSNWYFWALQNVKFPDDFEPDEEVRNATSIIRLITRVIFVWFLKQKGLIPDGLFDEKELKQILNYSDKTGSTYYKAILQNLFFATLNTGMTDDKRKFINRQYGVQGFYRYERFFNNKERFLELTRNIPFLNGGLFENLDKNVGEVNEIRIDCFSNKGVNETRLSFPDYLFFEGGEHADLNRAYGDSTHGNLKVRGLIGILKSYNFTIEENTPYEIEVALDPELLGKVFENLLASYNPETKTTARKQTGSFYTPRAIVNYMVDESILAYLKNKLLDDAIGKEDELEENLRLLLSYSGDENPFDAKDTINLLKAIDSCKILDPACGSGAFPMGVLQKMVHILQKLDKDNNLWRDLQRQKAIADTETAYNIGDKDERQKRLIDIDETFDYNASDYGRKLYLIENCIYGLDIQPIAVQIAKLRFFISLVCDQKTNNNRENLGIRPLPNLETKFVAANTLIGLNKANTAKPLTVYPLENELKEVRHKHFSARTPETKRKYREQDAILRKQISEELISVGFPPNAADQIANWNPYDQNISAHFFDTEWMFGLMQGFDIVVGNPPYKILTKNNSIELAEYSKIFKSFKNSSSKNLYILFIEKALQFLSKQGILSYIVPEGLFKTRSYSGCVELLDKSGYVKSTVSFSEYVFENVVTGSLIFVFNNNQKGQTNHFHFDKDFNLKILKNEINQIILKIKENAKSLNTLAILFKGMVVKDRETVLSKDFSGQENIFLLGKNINKWSVISKYYTNYLDLEIVGGTKKLEKHQQYPRILIRRTGDNLCCAFLDEPALTESTLYSCWSISALNNKCLIGLLNSKLLNYYNKDSNITNQQGFPQILMSDLEDLPIKIPKDQQSFITLVDLILAAKKADPTADTRQWETEIDALVFQLYGLTEEEMLQVLTSLPSVSEGERREIQAQWHALNK